MTWFIQMSFEGLENVHGIEIQNPPGLFLDETWDAFDSTTASHVSTFFLS